MSFLENLYNTLKESSYQFMESPKNNTEQVLGSIGKFLDTVVTDERLNKDIQKGFEYTKTSIKSLADNGFYLVNNATHNISTNEFFNEASKNTKNILEKSYDYLGHGYTYLSESISNNSKHAYDYFSDVKCSIAKEVYKTCNSSDFDEGASTPYEATADTQVSYLDDVYGDNVINETTEG